MKKLFIPSLIISSLLVSAPLLAANENGHPPSAANIEHQNQQKLNVVKTLYDGFFNGHDANVAKAIITEEYKQHNPFVGNGRAPFLAYFSQLFIDNPQYSARIYRSAVNGDLVYVHVKYQNNPEDRGTASVDIYRVNDQGKITEHWDVNQPVPTESANENTMF